MSGAGGARKQPLLTAQRYLHHVGEARKDLDHIGVLDARQHRHLGRILRMGLAHMWATASAG